MKTPYKKTRRSPLTRYLLYSLLFILVIVIGAIVGYNLYRSSPPITASPYTKGTLGNKSSIKPGSSSVTSSNGNGAGSSSTVNYLSTPTGDFVSDHHPNLSGSPAPNTLTSVCSSTPGASCYITFTQGSIVKSLPVQTLDAGGGTYWNWKLQDVGLTAGDWKIQAIVSLNGQTKTADDAMDLTVSQ